MRATIVQFILKHIVYLWRYKPLYWSIHLFTVDIFIHVDTFIKYSIRYLRLVKVVYRLNTYLYVSVISMFVKLQIPFDFWIRIWFCDTYHFHLIVLKTVSQTLMVQLEFQQLHTSSYKTISLELKILEAFLTKHYYPKRVIWHEKLLQK